MQGRIGHSPVVFLVFIFYQTNFNGFSALEELFIKFQLDSFIWCDKSREEKRCSGIVCVCALFFAPAKKVIKWHNTNIYFSFLFFLFFIMQSLCFPSFSTLVGFGSSIFSVTGVWKIFQLAPMLHCFDLLQYDIRMIRILQFSVCRSAKHIFGAKSCSYWYCCEFVCILNDFIVTLRGRRFSLLYPSMRCKIEDPEQSMKKYQTDTVLDIYLLYQVLELDSDSMFAKDFNWPIF